MPAINERDLGAIACGGRSLDALVNGAGGSISNSSCPANCSNSSSSSSKFKLGKLE